MQLEQVKRESLTDALTGISNRKAFDSALVQSIETAREETAPFSLLMLDIDHFKQFNDTYGHLIGDKVLRFIASILTRCIKGSDLAARYGGEEFAVILPNTPLQGAASVSEQIRKSISAGELKDKESGKRYGRITASIGIAEFHPEEAVNGLIERADQALYSAKKKGRNRVEQAN
jgi:diguanylate cyclase